MSGPGEQDRPPGPMLGGTERNHEPVPIAPIPPYQYTQPPQARSSPGVAPEQPKNPKPFIERVSPVAPVVHEQPKQQVTMSHPETVQLPEVQEVVRQPKPVQDEPKKARESVPKRVPETIANNSRTIPNHAQNEPEWKNAPEPENALNMPEIEDEGEVGRKRKYEDTGIYGDISVKDIILFRYIKKRHWPDLSGDMKAWYEHFYFKRPTKREKPYRGRDYEQHKRAYERGQEWIAEYNASIASTQAVGHSGNTVIPFQKRATS